MCISPRNFCLLALGFLPVLAFAALTNGKVQVGIVKDEAYLYDKQGKKEPLKSARVFQEGFRVETTAQNTVELILSNGSTLIVSPDTLLEVKTFRQVVSNLIVEGEYQKLDKEPSPSITEIEVIRVKSSARCVNSTRSPLTRSRRPSALRAFAAPSTPSSLPTTARAPARSISPAFAGPLRRPFLPPILARSR